MERRCERHNGWLAGQHGLAYRASKERSRVVEPLMCGRWFTKFDVSVEALSSGTGWQALLFFCIGRGSFVQIPIDSWPLHERHSHRYLQHWPFDLRHGTRGKRNIHTSTNQWRKAGSQMESSAFLFSGETRCEEGFGGTLELPSLQARQKYPNKIFKFYNTVRDS